MIRRENLFLSTIDPEAGRIARENGLGLEIAEFCTAFNIDHDFVSQDAAIRRELLGVDRCVYHGPFNELFPCAIDPKARELAAYRFSQALDLAESYGAAKVIFHGAYNPYLYFDCWYVEQSALFWKEFMAGYTGSLTICLENVLEPEPGLLLDIVKTVADPRLRLCLDVGHVNAYAKVPALDWITAWGSYLSHAHIHNNDGAADTHSALDQGSLPMEAILKAFDDHTTITLELPKIGNAVPWLKEKELLL